MVVCVRARARVCGCVHGVCDRVGSYGLGRPQVPPSAIPHRKAPRLIAKFTKSCPPSRLFALEPRVHSLHRATLSSGGSVDGIKIRLAQDRFKASERGAINFLGVPYAQVRPLFAGGPCACGPC